MALRSDSASGKTATTSADAAASRRAQALVAVEALRSERDVEASSRILFEAYYRPLLRFFVRKGLSGTEAQDLAQETFLGIFRGLKGLRHESRFEAWLYQIATTVFLKRLRSGSAAKRNGHEISHEDAGMSHQASRSPPPQLRGVLVEERLRVTREAIQALPDQMRKCLTLRHYHELSYREIAVVMKLKIDTVKAHLFQARKKLRETLKDYSLEVLDR